MTKEKDTTMCVDARTAKRFKCYNLLHFLRVIFSLEEDQVGKRFPCDEAHKRL